MKMNTINSFAISISYGNYAISSGGTDKFVMSEQRIFNRNGITLFHVFPLIAISRVKVKSGRIWGLCIDGIFDNYYTTRQLVLMIEKMCNNTSFYGFFIHHLRDINLSELKILLGICDADIYFYLHDYMTVCPIGGCIRNNKFCGASFPNIDKCKGCSSWNENTKLLSDKTRELFELVQNRISFIAPSDITKDLWNGAYTDFVNETYVINHQCLQGKYRENKVRIEKKTPLKLAFVGYQSPVKGWDEWFIAATEAHKNNRNYDLYQFGKCKNHVDYIKEVQVDFKEKDTAMIEALREHKIDCAILWSSVPETYSYTYYEAYSSNCFIITNRNSGNITRQVEKNGNGYISKDKESLIEILQDEDALRDRINRYKTGKEYGPYDLIDSDEILGYLNKKNIQFMTNDFGKDFAIIECIYARLINCMYTFLRKVLKR